jgi:hypothetical protein
LLGGRHERERELKCARAGAEIESCALACEDQMRVCPMLEAVGRRRVLPVRVW